MTETEKEHLNRLLNTSTADQTNRSSGNSLTDQATDKASELTDKVQSQVTSQVSAQKEKASETLSSVADALRQTGDQLQSKDQGFIADYTTKAAEEIDRFSGYLRTHDMNDLMNEVEQLARRQPAVFLGGAFAIGVLAARFFKSSSPQPRYGRSGQNYPIQRYRGYAQGPRRPINRSYDYDRYNAGSLYAQDRYAQDRYNRDRYGY